MTYIHKKRIFLSKYYCKPKLNHGKTSDQKDALRFRS